jgi:hypothetical protein
MIEKGKFMPMKPFAEECPQMYHEGARNDCLGRPLLSRCYYMQRGSFLGTIHAMQYRGLTVNVKTSTACMLA